MPEALRHAIRWDTDTVSYRVIERSGSAIRYADLDYQGQTWQEWLERGSSFAFQSKDGYRFTARKESRARGDAYWIAYRKIDGKLTHKYLGRIADVTLARMEEVAALMAGQEEQAPISGSAGDNQKHSVQEPIAEQLLVPKFFVPPSPPALVSRSRLTALLDTVLEYPLTLVSAPAGFGKTTLLSEWVRTLPPDSAQVAWVSLDEQDNNPVRFWMYAFSALDRLQPGLCAELVTYLDTQQAPAIQFLLTALINRLLEHPQRWLLVLDDYHLMTERQIHSSLVYLLEHLPPQLRLILASRIDPPLPLARFRARGQLLEVRADQLRATNDEAAAFMRDVLRVQLSDQELAVVQQRTENWLVGLQLVGLSLQGSSTPTRDLLAEVSGDQQYILDYLTDEVLHKQPRSVQTFLLRTSILDHLSAPLCDAVLEQQGSQHILESLERGNLFLTPLDGRRRWYRYHALFAQALRYRLEQEGQEALHALHLRASRWYAGRGQVSEAVQHALQAQAWQFAAELIEPVAQHFLWIRNHLPTLWGWLEQFPAQVLRLRPRLCLAYASILHLAARIKETEPWLEAAEAAVAATRTPLPAPTAESTLPVDPSLSTEREQDRLLGEILARRAIVAVYYGQSDTASMLCQQALAHLSDEDLYERAIVANVQGWISIIEDRSAETVARMLETSALMQAAGNGGAAMNYMSVAAYFLHLQGRLHEAWQMLERAIELGSHPDLPPSALVDLPRAWQAELLREWNLLDSALEQAEQGLRLAGQVGYTLYLDEIYMELVRIHLARGETAAARETLQLVLELPLLQDNSFYSAWITSVDQVRLWLVDGELQRAVEWTQALERREPLASPFARERQEVACVRVLLAQARPQEALARLEPLLVQAQKAGRWYHVIEMLVLQALAYHMRREEAAALRSLARALRLAEPEDYIRSFVDEGAPIAILLTTLRERERKHGPTPYLDRLLAAFAQEGRVVQTTPSADRISPREREVLRLLALGASNQEIADALVVTVETVKRHVSSLLSKLGVENRTQAAMRARALGLYEES